jgi:glycosyltransferase involved in cell wall biosynthesis
MNSATVVIAATGTPQFEDAVASVVNQTHPNTRCWVIIDGPEFAERTLAITTRYPSVQTAVLPENTGANGFYGHRIYAASSFMVNTDYVLYLDQDNWMQPNHVETQIANCVQNQLDWGYSLRSIYSPTKEYLLDDNCESLGRWPIFLSDHHYLVDTSCYCIKREVIVQIGGAWYGGWGGDRQFFANISKYFPRFDTTGLHTLCYRVDGNPGSVNKDFFVQGNDVMKQRYGETFPWNRTE